MTRGQEAFIIDFKEEISNDKISPINFDQLIVSEPQKDDISAHNSYLKSIDRKDKW